MIDERKPLPTVAGIHGLLLARMQSERTHLPLRAHASASTSTASGPTPSTTAPGRSSGSTADCSTPERAY